MAPYFQMLDQNAFGNYRSVLYDITLNPAMGFYLSTAGNSKIAPNENYAREIMQLFSIGVDTLNQDGTRCSMLKATASQPTIKLRSRPGSLFTGWNLKQFSVERGPHAICSDSLAR